MGKIKKFDKEKIKSTIAAFIFCLIFSACDHSNRLPTLNSGGISCSDLNCQAVGIYTRDAVSGGGSFPLLAFSTDGGKTFSSTSAVTLPKDALTGSGQTAAVYNFFCSGLKCLAVGMYVKDAAVGGGIFPFRSFSTDGGHTYTDSSEVPLPEDALAGSASLGVLFGLSCSNLKCLAVGNYIKNNGATAPLVLSSVDAGVTFKSNSEVTLPEDAFTGIDQVGKFFGVSCAGSKCLVVGSYRKNTSVNLPGVSPLLSFSADGGKKFTSTSEVTLPEDALTEKNQFAAELTGVSCLGSTCHAVGIYTRNAAEGGGLFPLLSFSTNGGKTFSSTSAVTLPEDAATGNGQLSQISGFSCAGSKCLGVGGYTRNAVAGGGCFPLLSFSTDGGKTYKISTSAVTLPEDAATGSNQFALLY